MMKLIFIALFIGYASAVALPNEWERCKVSITKDYKRNKCIERTVTNIVKYLSINGEQSLGLPKLDPLRIKNMTIGQLSSTDPVGFQQDMWNLDLIGLSTIKHGMMHIDGKLSSPQNWSIHFTSDPWNLTTQGIYKVSGRFLFLPVRGEGKCLFNLDDVTTEMWVNGKPQIKNGEEYLKITDWKYESNVKRLWMRMDNLLGGGELGENMNRIVNQNWEFIWTEVKPKIDKSIGETYISFAKKIMEKIPYKDLIISE